MGSFESAMSPASKQMNRLAAAFFKGGLAA